MVILGGVGITPSVQHAAQRRYSLGRENGASRVVTRRRPVALRRSENALASIYSESKLLLLFWFRGEREARIGGLIARFVASKLGSGHSLTGEHDSFAPVQNVQMD
jgi:hypothetical protein